ncbi:unnamed protein product [marine sediment metagenome]|uniref:Uncharacterized protein n=1 Tax=marine sediment metagenome TaxID=412755 RepID=X1KM54_9ZZZZ
MIYTRRQVKKKLYLVLLLGVLLGWCAHVLTVQAVIYYHQSKPIILGSVAYASQGGDSFFDVETRTYKVVVYSLFGRIVARFKGGVALWNRPELIKRLFIKRFKPSTAVYIYRVYAPSGEYKQGKILVGDNPDPGK